MLVYIYSLGICMGMLGDCDRYDAKITWSNRANSKHLAVPRAARMAEWLIRAKAATNPDYIRPNWIVRNGTSQALP